MALLIAPLGGAPEWKRLIAAAMPELDVRVFPEIGNPAEIDAAAIARIPPGTLAALPNLKLIISLMAGQETVLADKTLPANVPMVRAGDPAGDTLMNDTALLHVLRHHRFLTDYLLQQQRREWKRLPVQRPSERKVGVMGLGEIGIATARFLKNYGFNVAGWARTKRPIDGIEAYFGRGELPAFLGHSEIVVCLLALTPETTGILNRETFTQMPKGASVINLARGPHVVDRDVIDALDSGHLSGATLDVFHEEPLGKESPLWQHPRITIIPHASRRHDAVDVVPRVVDHLRRLAKGEKPIQLVDRAAGY